MRMVRAIAKAKAVEIPTVSRIIQGNPVAVINHHKINLEMATDNLHKVSQDRVIKAQD